MEKNIQLDCSSCSKKNNSLISVCSCEEIKEISSLKICSSFKKGHVLFGEGSLPLGLYCISEGSVKIVRAASGGKEQIIRIANPGDIIGYRSLITHKRYTSSAIAVEDSKVCLIPKEDFYNLITINKKFHEGLVLLLCNVIEDTEYKITDIAYKPVRGRIAEALVLLSKANNHNGLINLSREELASFVGTVKETVIRTLSEFKEENLIEIEKRTLKIKNEDGLIRISNLYD